MIPTDSLDDNSQNLQSYCLVYEKLVIATPPKPSEIETFSNVLTLIKGSFSLFIPKGSDALSCSYCP